MGKLTAVEVPVPVELVIEVTSVLIPLETAPPAKKIPAIAAIATTTIATPRVTDLVTPLRNRSR